MGDPHVFFSAATVAVEGLSTMSRDFVGALLQLNAEKQVPREQLIRTVEEAIAAAYRRVANEEDIHVQIDADSGRIRVYRARVAVSEIEDELTQFTLDEARRYKAD
ncbi:MAG TPA: NusA N-terminal domain-containing protein, partial [Candidatus Binatus sp.]|nr:NusA N-terminal domain-containing protein [Candidatus Binatus sp.]